LHFFAGHDNNCGSSGLSRCSPRSVFFELNLLTNVLMHTAHGKNIFGQIDACTTIITPSTLHQVNFSPMEVHEHGRKPAAGPTPLTTEIIKPAVIVNLRGIHMCMSNVLLASTAWNYVALCAAVIL